MLLTEDGKVISLQTTDNSGFFKFDKLDPDKRYIVKLDESDPRFKDKEKYYLTDEKDKIIRVTVINEKGGKFCFQNLPADPNGLPELGAGDDVTIAGNLLYGENTTAANQPTLADKISNITASDPSPQLFEFIIRKITTQIISAARISVDDASL